MPALRTSRRRRSSLALLTVNPLKHGNHGIGQASPKSVTFAPNVTPVTFVEPENDSLDSEPASPTSTLFPPATSPAPPSRKRCPPGKRRSQGYIPRPPNAFMLFRADFVRQKHVPGSIETNHGSLSKIIGNCWHALPLEERRVWEIKAKHAKAEHKQMYPNYRFRPVHNKSKEKKPKSTIPAEDEKRCEDVAQLLLEGMKGEELAAAVKRLDRMRSATPLNLPRRPSSVPLPNSFPIAIPALPFVQASRPQSPLYMNPPRYTLPRRPSSAVPSLYRSWTEPFSIPREPSPMPEINASLFNGPYLDNAFPSASSQSDVSFDFGSMFSSLPGGSSPQELFISPLDSIIPGSLDSQSAYPSAPLSSYSLLSSATSPVPPSTYSGSPAPSDFSLPLHAPQPSRPFESSQAQVQTKANLLSLDLDLAAYTQGLAGFNIPMDMGLSYVVPEMPPLSFDISEQLFADAFQEQQQQQRHQAQVPIAAPIAVPVDAGINFNDVLNEF
ncbi:hypothetical protein B0F90DRAFT_1658827 [Multifurca ochricompacta]|uniref:HMG box domain-containing protein n=1 Tax=Multifurca ochricompacta TaxID=376703 RepID=A0AAD4LTD5_9AGAM|nr:hypothetical protein B0F90DRAFT_1658827 [Multifurca ochricompacta]